MWVATVVSAVFSSYFLLFVTIGVRLCLDGTVCSTVIPNNTILHPGNISRDGLSCVSALNVNDIGEWIYPNGEEVTRSPGSVFTPLSRIRHVVLLRGEADFTSDAEGVYTCHIPDESRVQRTLYVGIYQTSTYENSSEQLCRQRCWSVCM